MSGGCESSRKDDEGEHRIEVPHLPVSQEMVLKEGGGRGLEGVTDYSYQTTHGQGNVEIGGDHGERGL